MGLIDWIKEAENVHFALHVVAIFVLSLLAEIVLNGWTGIIYPVIIMLAAISFMLRYPVSAIKTHGIFSEYLIELRLLWLFILGIMLEYLAYAFYEQGAIGLYSVIALVAGLVALFYSRSHLQEKIEQARGFK